MGKRSNLVVVLSSDEDDDEENSNKNCSSSNSMPIRSKSKLHLKFKSTTSSTRRGGASRKAKKKPRLADSLSSSVELFSGFDELKLLSQDFAEEFAGFKVSTGCRGLNVAESWVDRYRPHSLEELAVQKKKVEEVKMWFQERLKTPKKGCQNYVLLITGQSGTGKSETVHVMASHFGVEVCEWNTPTPTIWQEHVHNLNSGMRYVSKLDEFENFVDRVRKYGILSLSVTAPMPSLILLIEDLPVANGKIAQGRLLRCLQLLVKSVQVPTVVLITDYGGGDSADVNMRYWEELSSSLENAGACKVSFNPITGNSIKKVLSRICKQEQCNITCEQIELIANTSGGDIRHAIATLHYLCVKQENKIGVSSNKCSNNSEAKASNPGQKDGSNSLPVGRDLTLSLFHALGKFLHNKRETEHSMESDDDGFHLRERFRRLPLKMDAPEKVLCQAYGQARPVAEFLHENVIDFLSQDAIDDAWAVASYLSDADCLLSAVRRTFARNYEAENVVQSAAASVAVRGVLFGNAHPSSSRWHSIRRPMLWQAEQSAGRNMHELERQRFDHYNGQSLVSVSDVCTEYRPALKWLGYRASLSSEHRGAHSSLILGEELENGELDEINSLEQGQGTDDEIEDW